MMKTGYRPDPTVEHPSIGAICCHELPVGPTDIPRHVSILPGSGPAGAAFLAANSTLSGRTIRKGSSPDVVSPGPTDRDERRVARSRGGRARLRPRPRRRASTRRLHRETIARARSMMTSDQLKAFDVSQEPAQLSSRLWRHPLRPRLPGRPPAHRGRRPLRRGDARRLGLACQQSRDPPQPRQGP